MIGRGAYAKVYKYHDSDGDQALKHYSVRKGTGLSPAYRELEFLSYLSHPNIIRMTDVYFGIYEHANKCKSSEEDGQLHIIMELAKCSLGSIIQEKMDIILIKKYVRDILLGLEYLHKNNIVHRDLNDGNILVMNDGRLCICDLGMSKHYLSELEVNDDYVHPFVRSPEMHAKKSYDYRVDIWSLGILVVNMLLGKNPFSENIKDSIRDIIAYIPLLPKREDLIKWINKSTKTNVNNFEQLIERRYAGEGGLPNTIDGQAKEFVSCCLAFYHKHRWYAGQLLEHPWLKEHFEYIKDYRTKYLRITIPDPNISNNVLLPSSPIRTVIRKYILEKKDYVASDIDRTTSRICLALNIFYRLIMSKIEETDDEDTRESIRYIQNNYASSPFSLFVITFIVTMKYCATNSTPIITRFIPDNNAELYNSNFIANNELHIIRALRYQFYRRTTYDILISLGMRVDINSWEQPWMRYLSGETRICNIEEEYRKHLSIHSFD